jgi:hypothetical protein
MAICRFYPSADTYITNRILDNNPSNRATSASLGAGVTLQCFKITSSFPTSPSELARSLVNIDFRQLSGMVFNDQTIPTGSVRYVLRAFNYPIGEPTPSSFDLSVCAVSSPWDEGVGQDDRTWMDGGYANWYAGTSTSNWISAGGDYLLSGSGTQHFDAGDEDLEVDVTSIVQSWLTGSIMPYGLMVKLADTCENNQNDYYRKVFYSHETHTVEKVPYLEARWNDRITDNRANFAYNNPNALYLYNCVRGYLKDIVEPVTVRLQDNLVGESASFQQIYSASRAGPTGIYASAIGISASNPNSFSSSWVDIWEDGTGMCLMTGTLFPKILTGTQGDPYEDFIVNVVDLKPVYRTDETARITVNVRRNYHNDHLVVHTASIDSPPREYMEDMYWSVVNNESGETLVPFGIGPLYPYTKLSYNESGNYFQIAMSSFVPGFTYRFIFLIKWNRYEKDVIDNKFIFKVQ